LKDNKAWMELTSRTRTPTGYTYNRQEDRLIMQIIDSPQIKHYVSVTPYLEKPCRYCPNTVYFDKRIKSKNGFLIPLNKDRSIHDHPFLIRIAKSTECREVAFESVCHFFDKSSSTSTKVKTREQSLK
jgi:hypothetical protein